MKNSDVKLYRKYLEFIKLLNIYLNHFPKHEKFALVLTIKNHAYQLYNLIIECQKRYHKKTSLTLLDITHEQLRMQLYLAYELGYFKFTNNKNSNDSKVEEHRWITISNLVNELGKMIGGWIKFEVDSSKG